VRAVHAPERSEQRGRGFKDETGARPFKGSVRYNYRLRFAEALPRTAETWLIFRLAAKPGAF